MRDKNIFCILHFQPLEKFPPVMNMLDFLGDQDRVKLYVVSRRNTSGGVLNNYVVNNDQVKIIRTGWFADKGPLRIVNYILFYLQAFWVLLKHTPEAVLYYETLSSWPALWYKKLKGQKVKLLAHYHEYNTLHEFSHSMKLMKWQHTMETDMYAGEYAWISHTNEVRLDKFRKDHRLANGNENIFRLMPNYPGKNWLSKEPKPMEGQLIKLVYVGSLGYDNMYVKEIIEFVQQHSNRFSLDLYAYNIHTDVKDMLEALKAPNVIYHGGCDYSALPGILKNYDIGLVIYKSFSENWINAVSNKVFEYLACGLDVWFSQDMVYTLKYVRQVSYPKVIAVDFTDLQHFDFETAIGRKGLPYKEPEYFYEAVYPEIYQAMQNEKQA